MVYDRTWDVSAYNGTYTLVVPPNATSFCQGVVTTLTGIRANLTSAINRALVGCVGATGKPRMFEACSPIEGIHSIFPAATITQGLCGTPMHEGKEFNGAKGSLLVDTHERSW